LRKASGFSPDNHAAVIELVAGPILPLVGEVADLNRCSAVCLLCTCVHVSKLALASASQGQFCFIAVPLNVR
jgi:hypothetical protein